MFVICRRDRAYPSFPSWMAAVGDEASNHPSEGSNA